MRSTFNRHAAPISLIALCCALAPIGCDKEEEKKDEAKAPAEAKKDEAKKDEAKKDEAKKDDGGEAKVDPRDAEIAALKAELDAANEAAEAAKEIDPEAAKAIDEPVTPEDEVAHEKPLEEGKKGPVSVAKVTFEEKKPMFGAESGVRFELAADMTLNESKDGGVYAKASCLVGDQVFVNVSTLSNKFGELGKMKEGETKRVDTRLFGMSGLAAKPTRCQLSFDYGATSFSTRIADACWDGTAVTDGLCKEPLEPKAKGDGKIVPFDFKVEPHKALGATEAGATALNVSYGARFNEHIEEAPHLHTKTACKVGDKVWVEVSPDFPHVKPFSLEHGEAVMVHHNQFFMNALPGAPEACNIEVLLDGGWGKEDQKLAEVCAKAGTVTDGKCDFRTDPEGAPAPVDAESITIDELTLEWGNDWRDKSKAVLQVKLAATVQKGIADRVQMTGKVTCGGKDDEEHHIGPDLEYVGAGETVGVNFAAFRDPALDGPAGRCELTFGAKPFMDRGEGVEITKFCLKGDKVTAGKCKGKGKGKAAGIGAPMVFASDAKKK